MNTIAKRGDTPEHFDFCIDAYLAGDTDQAKEIFNTYQKKQKHEILDHLNTHVSDEKMITFFQQLLVAEWLS